MTNILNKIFKKSEDLFDPICDNCKKGRVRFDRYGYDGRIYFHVYKCDNCGQEFK